MAITTNTGMDFFYHISLKELLQIVKSVKRVKDKRKK